MTDLRPVFRFELRFRDRLPATNSTRLHLHCAVAFRWKALSGRLRQPQGGDLAVETGIWPLYEVEEGKLKMYGKSKHIATGAMKRKPVREYLTRQGRFAHFAEEDIEYFQGKVDEMWEKWLLPGVIPFAKA